MTPEPSPYESQMQEIHGRLERCEEHLDSIGGMIRRQLAYHEELVHRVALLEEVHKREHYALGSQSDGARQ